MFNRDRWVEIFDTIQKNKLRTVLSGFTIALGIFIFVLLFGLGNGLKNTFQEFFLDDATNSFSIGTTKTKKAYKGYKTDRRVEFKNEDLQSFYKNFKSDITHISPRIYRNYTIRYKNKSNNYDMRAVSEDHLEIEKTIITKGRFITPSDVRNREKFIVIGRQVEKDLFGEKNSMDKYLDVSGIMYKVVGVFRDDGNDREERKVYIPYTTVQLTERNSDVLDEILINYHPDYSFGQVLKLEEEIEQFMKERLLISPKDNGGIRIRNRAQNMQDIMNFASLLQIIVSFVGFGTLLSGIIGISNIMVYIVKERTKEIGIRKALGATPASITGMILQESVVITLAFGYLGLISAIVVLSQIKLSLEDFFIKNPYVDMPVAIGATLILVLFGSIAGYLPASKAAKIKPIIALRND